ncbi:hypothetical protein BJD20_13260 [Acinetobacter proteolyticus]|nr:hypothetical protein BJD20_13260 [Acinetobacter proteolyticus]
MHIDYLVFSNSSRARTCFVEARTQAKDFLKEKMNYKKPDFPRMILDLRNLKWSHLRIAHVLDLKCASTVSAWATGTRPFFENGEHLISLWRDQTGLERVPRIGEHLTYRYDVKAIHERNTANKTLAEREFSTSIFDSILDDVTEQLEAEMSYEDILRLNAEYGAGIVTAQTTKAHGLYLGLAEKGRNRRANMTKHDGEGR